MIYRWMLVSIAIVCLVAGCGPRQKDKQEEEAAVETWQTAIDKYLVEELGSQYAPGEYCIPNSNYAVVVDQNPEDIQVLGDFWVFNYKMAGDTLKTVSGGNHPGKMHVRQDADGHFEVTAFDAVQDGADNDSSAREIFGDNYDAFRAAQANAVGREAGRKAAVQEFVSKNGLQARFYQDFGWPAVALEGE